MHMNMEYFFVHHVYYSSQLNGKPSSAMPSSLVILAATVNKRPKETSSCSVTSLTVGITFIWDNQNMGFRLW